LGGSSTWPRHGPDFRSAIGDGMNGEEFLARVNARAKARYGTELKKRELRDLIDEDIVPGPKPMGRRREWRCWRRYRRALEVCRHKGRGAKRRSDIRFRQYLDGRAVPLDLLRQDVASEFARARKLLLRPMVHDAGPRVTNSARRLKTLTRHVGEASPAILPKGFSYTKEEPVAAYDAMRFGQGGAGFHEILCGILGRLEFPEASRRAFATLLSRLLVGFFGDLDEVERSALEAIDGSSLEQFAHTRDLYHCLRWLGKHAVDFLSAAYPPLGQAMEPWRGPIAIVSRLEANPWGFAIFVVLLQLVKSNLDFTKIIQEIAGNVLLALAEDP
jgi:hypothetical protein